MLESGFKSHFAHGPAPQPQALRIRALYAALLALLAFVASAGIARRPATPAALAAFALALISSSPLRAMGQTPPPPPGLGGKIVSLQVGGSALVSLSSPGGGASWTNTGSASGLGALQLDGGAAYLPGSGVLNLPSGTASACASGFPLSGGAVTFAVWVYLSSAPPTSAWSIFSVVPGTCACVGPPHARTHERLTAVGRPHLESGGSIAC